MLGKSVYFCDKKTWKVGEGIALSHIIGDSGYDAYTVYDGSKTQSVESALIFTSKEDAQKKCEEAKPISDLMIKIEKEMIEELNALREKVLGKPQFKEVANAIKSKSIR